MNAMGSMLTHIVKFAIKSLSVDTLLAQAAMITEYKKKKM